MEAENLTELSEEHRLLYQTYKLLIHFEQSSNIRVKQAVLHFITNDKGSSFFFKSLECLKIEKRASVEEIGVELPTKREIQPQDSIHLPSEMKKLFQGFQKQFQRIDKERLEMQNRLNKDKNHSNMVFKSIVSGSKDNFHDILGSNNLKYKRSKLNL